MSNEDFEIEIEEIFDDEAESVQLPLNFLSLGEIAADDVKVYIRQNVYNDLEKFAASDTSKELGSILIGDVCEAHGHINVIISDYIEAKYTDASASTLTFTHETWDYINKEKEKKFPDKKIIGWQHTHPGYGIFLSNYDMFIQENFFNLPFQTAYVIDPKQQLRGFFQWKNSKVEKLKGFYVYDEVGKKIKVGPPEKKAPQKESKSAFDDKFVKLIVCMAIVLGIIAVSAVGVSVKIADVYNEKISELSALLEDSHKYKRTADELAELLEGELSGVEGIASIDRIITLIENGTLKVDDKERVIAELTAVRNDVGAGNNSVRFITYTVGEGDTLTEICEKNNIDFSAFVNTIVALNGLENENTVYAGQQLILPVSGK